MGAVLCRSLITMLHLPSLFQVVTCVVAVISCVNGHGFEDSSSGLVMGSGDVAADFGNDVSDLDSQNIDLRGSRRTLKSGIWYQPRPKKAISVNKQHNIADAKYYGHANAGGIGHATSNARNGGLAVSANHQYAAADAGYFHGNANAYNDGYANAHSSGGYYSGNKAIAVNKQHTYATANKGAASAHSVGSAHATAY